MLLLESRSKDVSSSLRLFTYEIQNRKDQIRAKAAKCTRLGYTRAIFLRPTGRPLQERQNAGSPGRLRDTKAAGVTLASVGNEDFVRPVLFIYRKLFRPSLFATRILSTTTSFRSLALADVRHSASNSVYLLLSSSRKQ